MSALHHLTSFELGWAEAALSAMFPGSESLADIGHVEYGLGLRGYLADVCARLPSRSVFGLRLAIWIVALAPLFVLHRLTTVVRLGVADRERLVVALIQSDRYVVRALVMTLKTIGALFYAGAPQVRARMRGARRLLKLRRSA